MAKWSNAVPGQSGHLHMSLRSADGRQRVPRSVEAARDVGRDALVRRRPAGADAGAARDGRLHGEQLLAPGAGLLGADLRDLGHREPHDGAARDPRRSLEPARRVPDRGRRHQSLHRARRGHRLRASGASSIASSRTRRSRATPTTASTRPSGACRRHLYEAAERLAASKAARALFGDAFVEHYAATRQWEEREFRKAITDWELAALLRNHLRAHHDRHAARPSAPSTAASTSSGALRDRRRHRSRARPRAARAARVGAHCRWRALRRCSAKAVDAFVAKARRHRRRDHLADGPAHRATRRAKFAASRSARATCCRSPPEALAAIDPGREGRASARQIKRVPLGVVAVVAPWNYPVPHGGQRRAAGADRRQRGGAQAFAPDAAVRASASPRPSRAPALPARRVPVSAPVACRYRAADGRSRASRTSASPARCRAAARWSRPRPRGFATAGLELGGKDPAYVRADANLAHAVETLTDGAFFNAGQSCCGIKRIYVAAPRYEEFVAGVVAPDPAVPAGLAARSGHDARARWCARPPRRPCAPRCARRSRAARAS